MEGLKKTVVSQILLDDRELKKQFLNMVCTFLKPQSGLPLICQTSAENCEIEGWITSRPVEILGKTHYSPRIIGPSKNISAIIVNPHLGLGFVKIVHRGQEFETLHTYSNSENEAVMVILQPGFHCVLEGKTHVKFIEGRSNHMS